MKSPVHRARFVVAREAGHDVGCALAFAVRDYRSGGRYLRPGGRYGCVCLVRRAPLPASVLVAFACRACGRESWRRRGGQRVKWCSDACRQSNVRRRAAERKAS